MSTTIYDVFKSTKLNMSEIIDLLIEKRKLYLSYTYSHFINQMLKEAVEIYDISKKQGLPETSSYYGLVEFEEFLRKTFSILLENEKNNVFAPDARLIIGVRPIKYNDEDFTLVAPFGSQELVNLFVEDNKDWLTNFEYYDNTDKPETISDEGWDERKKIWDIVFDKFWSRREAMFMYEINDKCLDLPHIGFLFRGCDKSKIIIPTDEKRIKTQLRDWYCNEKIIEFGKDNVLNNIYTHLHDFPHRYDKGDFDEQKKQITLHPLDGNLINFLKNEA